MDAVRPLVPSGFESGPPAEGAAPRHARDGAIHRDQGRQSGLPAVLPDGRFLRAVLRGRRDRRARARHRADQARQASRPRHPDVRRAGPSRRRISPPPDRDRPSRRGVRAARGPRRGEEARRQERGAARRHPPGHARHAHRGHAARRASATTICSPSRARARPPARTSRFALAWIDISTGEFRIAECDRAGAGGRHRAARARRDHRLGRALRRRRARALPAHAAGGDAAHPRRVRRRHAPSAGWPPISGLPPPKASARCRGSSSPPPPPASPMWSARSSASGRRSRRRCARRRARRC